MKKTLSLGFLPVREDMRRHLIWLVSNVSTIFPDLRIEIAWGDPMTVPNRAETFPISGLDRAINFAVGTNKQGNNFYVGVTLKRAGTPARGRTGTEHAVVATGLAIDIDGDFLDAARKLGTLVRPQLLILTGREPQPRGQLWVRVSPTEDMKLWSEVNLRSVHFSGGDRNALGIYRLMRLAGSVSYPSPHKQERGYMTELTTLHAVKAPAFSLNELL